MKKGLQILVLCFLVQLSFGQPKTQWTVETLKELQDVKIKALEEKTELQFRLNQVAIDRAQSNMNVRLDGMNEWRGTVKDQNSSFATKDEVNALTKLVYVGLGIMLSIQFLLKFRQSKKGTEQ